MKRKSIQKSVIGLCLFGILFIFSTCMVIVHFVKDVNDNEMLLEQQEILKEVIAEDVQAQTFTDVNAFPSVGAATIIDNIFERNEDEELPMAGVAGLLGKYFNDLDELYIPTILAEYSSLYQENNDMIGWLRIDDTLIDYPVMQTIWEEEYYLNRDFYGEENSNGSLILDTESNAGVGIADNNYQNGQKPSVNLIIHGHTMRSGQMFGDLDLYRDEEYGMEHNIICFDSLYEKREYELIAVFYSQVYYSNQDVFKYYNFFEADTQEEFDEWYYNIKALSLYDTGVTAEFGDEFITLSCCAYHVEDGRFVVVGRRIK